MTALRCEHVLTLCPAEPETVRREPDLVAQRASVDAAGRRDGVHHLSAVLVDLYYPPVVRVAPGKHLRLAVVSSKSRA